MVHKEENNYPKAIAISVGIMGFLLLVSFFIVIGSFQPKEEFGMGGMVVNYGTAAEGMGDDYTSIEEPSMAENANQKLPDKVTPETKVTPNTPTETSKEIQTQNTEDAVAVTTKTQKTTVTATSTKEEKPAKPAINPNALYTGKKNNGTGQGDGTGNTPGNQGDPDGDPLAPNYGEGGAGNGNQPISLDKFSNLSKPIDNSQIRGKVAIKAFYDSEGRIINAKVYLQKSTTADPELQRKCLEAVLKSSLIKSKIDNNIRSGIVIFSFGLQ
ncbi:energy transducer TonB [Pedobacter sp. KR3-3]|uniref:Energy transducer TonB n=1 Tax=Pedobacter albus TaxID=3113905 RepID=A0ABU7I1X5_9SPHI|nr:energy transducer TonB [Pedobacter sp. KR3-3]MEE1943473.1 energy transducer TonB [Pedobacter sp. KR3-3]